MVFPKHKMKRDKKDDILQERPLTEESKSRQCRQFDARRLA
jgi:hypothetical protein